MLHQIISGNIDLTGAIVYILSSLTVIFLTLPIHEFAHGFAATKLGDPTPRYQGRMTLNPFAHIDYIGALCILLLGFGWAKPVQVNSNNFRSPKRDMAITALAGPVSNVIVAFIALLLSNTIGLFASDNTVVIYILSFFWWVASINVTLAVFNLIPIPPLDGSRILSACLPNKYYYALMRYERYIFLGLLLILYLGILDPLINFMSNGVFTAVYNLANLPFRLFR